MSKRILSNHNWLWPLGISLCAALGVAQAEMFDVEYRKAEETVNADGVAVKRGAEFSAVSYPVKIDVKLTDLPPAPQWQPGDPITIIPRLRGEPRLINPRPVNPVFGPDPLLEVQEAFSAQRGFDFTMPLVNIGGQSSGSNPHDANGEVGPDFFVQTINSGGSRVQFYNKADGSTVGASFLMENLPAAAGACANGLGDPIPFYDEIADRWVLTEFSTQAGRSLCVYVAQTNDPINGGWFGYQFQTPSFPDYPKYGVWHDAYYVGTNEATSSLYAMEREQMLQGLPAGIQSFTISDPAAFSFAMIPPVDHDGIDPPPASEPGIFIRHFDDEAHAPGSNNPAADQLQIWEFEVDWATPGNTQLTGPFNIDIAEIDSEQCGFTAFACYPQPGTSTTLDPLREVVMNMPKYRNFGSHEVLLGNLTTDIDGTDHGGVRWFELRRVGGGNWTLHQEGTYAPDIDDGAGAVEHRWMGASAMDESGNIALGYSISNDTNLFPSIAYTGREASDPPGVMSQTETFTIVGTGNHTSSTRWGDYASMSVDPADGCTFWLTSNYGQSGGSTALTQISSFRFANCGVSRFTLAGDAVDQQICLNPAPASLTTVNLNIGSVNGFTNPVSLALNPPPPAGFSLSLNPTTVMPPGSATLSGTVLAGTAPGDYTITVEGTATGADPDTVQVLVNIADDVPAAATLTAPGNASANVDLSPILSWSAAAQALEYAVEIATDAGFGNIVYQATVDGTSHQVATTLASSTLYFWRVTAGNQCGDGVASSTFNFTTQPLPGDCPAGVGPNVLFSDDIEGGVNGWTSEGTENTWQISTDRPLSGLSSWHAEDVPMISDQRLISPAFTLPGVDQLPISISYQNWQQIEQQNATNCWDAAILEISTDDGATWTQLESELLTQPYDGVINDFTGGPNPLANLNGWCGDPRDWTRSVVDLNAFAGQTVRIGFRLGTDGTVGREGWYIDDVEVQSCPSSDTILMDGFEELVF
ncbi:MAG: hypothetical protein Tsb002_28920 [Wenzhouxiangellaceae bacterium]